MQRLYSENTGKVSIVLQTGVSFLVNNKTTDDRLKNKLAKLNARVRSLTVTTCQTLNQQEENIMAGKANPCGKTRPVDKPYEVWTSRDGAWEDSSIEKISARRQQALCTMVCCGKIPVHVWRMGVWRFLRKNVKAGTRVHTQTPPNQYLRRHHAIHKCPYFVRL